MNFFLGTHSPSWLASQWLTESDVPLFISRRRLAKLKKLPKARGPWALDSSGFTELSMHGRWTVEPERYADEVRRFANEIGNLQFAACQDWMCEPDIRMKTGRSVEQHQALTVENYLRLRELAPDLPWLPVLQGWTRGEYLDHVRLYERAGVDLRALPLVGVGSVCRRQSTISAGLLFRWLHDEGLRLHGFGLKTQGLIASAEYLVSADSMAWSLNARRNPRRPGCTHTSCSNCQLYALDWYDDLVERVRSMLVASDSQ